MRIGFGGSVTAVVCFVLIRSAGPTLVLRRSGIGFKISAKF